MDHASTAKQALRRSTRAALAATSDADRVAWSAAICDRIRALGHFAAARTLLSFAPMLVAGEVDVLPLALEVRRRGGRVAFPRVEWARPGAEISLVVTDDPSRDLQPDPSRPDLRQPRVGLPEIGLDEVDIVLVPGVAFDADRYRLGRGGGHYDRLLSPRGGKDRPIAIAPAFDCQIVPALPREAHDQPVDLIATPSRLIR